VLVSQQSVPGRILIREGVVTPVIAGITKPIAQMQTLCSSGKEGDNMNNLYVGIDIGSRDNSVFFMLPDGGKHSSFSVKNNPDGARTISARIVAALTEKGISSTVIGMEATSVYGDNLLYFLREDLALAKFCRRFHVLNPKQVKKFKDAHSDLPKNDDVDAFIIADDLRFGRITKAVFEDDYRYDALRTLTRARYFATQNLVREKQRFINYLFMKCSGLAQDNAFSDNFGVAAMELYDFFETPDSLAKMNVRQLAAFISEKGKNRFPDPDKVANAVIVAAKNSYNLPDSVNASITQVMSISISSVRAMQNQIKTLDKEIERQFENIPNVLISIPGIGKVYSAGIIAEIGDVNRFDGQASLAKHAGLVWKENQSGTFKSQNTRLIKSGNRFLRYYLCEAAFSLVRCDMEYKRFYDLKYKEVNKFQHKRALVLTARKFVRLVFRLLKDNRLYIPA
jgi:transposase